MPTSHRIDRARACMLGMAVGDALGAPLEGLVAQQIRAHYGSVDDYVDGTVAWKRKPYRWRLRGLYTDDTQQALALADTLVAHGGVDVEHLAGLYLAMAHPRGAHLGAHRGVGRTFRQVVGEWERGASPRETGVTSAGIGAAMRIAPAAIYHVGEPDALFRTVIDASLMTHRDIRSLSGALAVAHAVQLLLDGSPREPSLLFRVAAAVRRAEDRLAACFAEHVVGLGAYRHSLSSAIAHAESILEMPRDRALGQIVEEANRHGADPCCKRPTMGFPPALIPTCLYLLLTTDSFEDALVEVVNMGGDADTAGAILGALAGAHYGLDAIPDRWLTGLRNRSGIDLRARALACRSAEGLAIPDLVATEHSLTAEEAASRETRPAQGREGAAWHPPAGADPGPMPPTSGPF